MSFTLVLPYPVSANRYWASRVIKVNGKPMPLVYVTAEAKEFKAKVRDIARAAGIKHVIRGRVALHLQLFPHRPIDWKKRMRLDPIAWDDTVQCIDLGNAEKVMSDALQGIVIEDDKMIWKQSKERMLPDDGPARMVVMITPIVMPKHPQGDLLGTVPA